jgi:hypothetical protein
MKAELLIRALVADAVPVRRLAPPGLRCAGWLALTSGLLTCVTMRLGVRWELLGLSQNTRWLWLEGVSLLLLGILSARSAFQLSVPARRPSTLFGLPLASCLLWLGLLASRLAATGTLEAGPGSICVLRIAALGVPALVLGWRMQRKGALLEAGWSGLFMGLAAFSLAALAARLLCARDGAAHLLLWHCLPVLLLVGCAALAAVRRRAQRSSC